MSKQSWQHPDTIITSIGMRLDNLTQEQEDWLFQAGQLQLTAVCRVLQYLNPHKQEGVLTDKEIEQALCSEFLISRRWARAWLKEAKASRTGIIELANTRLTGASERLKRLEKRVNKTQVQVRNYYSNPKKPKKWVQTKQGRQLQDIPLKDLQRNAQHLRARLDRQTTKIEKLEKLVNGEIEPSICFGTKKLARKRHGLETQEEILEWRKEWEQARYGHLFMEGDKDRKDGNPYFQYNRVKNNLKITLPLKDSVTSKNIAFNTTPTSNDQRLDALLLGYDGPVTTRLTYNKKKGYWYAHFTVRESVAPVWTSKQNGAIGVDLNPNHIAYSYINKQGNPIIKDTGRIEIIMGNQTQATIKRASQTAKQLVELATIKQCPIVLEDLNFGAAKLNLRYLPKKLRVKFSSFAYNTYKTIIQREATRAGVEVILVHPAYTSKLGQANYANPYGVSVDMAASIIIARRALKFRERIRASVLDRLELEDSNTLKQLSRLLPVRRLTWEDERLSRSRLSAHCLPLTLPPGNTSNQVGSAGPREPAKVPHSKT